MGLSIGGFFVRQLAAEAAACWRCDAAMAAAMRTKGAQRTPSKRALLATINRPTAEVGPPFRVAHH